MLDPLDASPPGSAWWRAVNERLLRDGCETVALLGGLDGEPSSPAVRLWLEFAAQPDGAQLVPGAQREHRGRHTWSTATSPKPRATPERFFMNVALLRVLYAHSLARRRAWRWDGSLRSAACWAIPGSGWPACSSRCAACCRTATRSNTTWSATSPPSSASAGCSTTR